MSIAAYNRGSRLVAREADERMPVAVAAGEADASSPRGATGRGRPTDASRGRARPVAARSRPVPAAQAAVGQAPQEPREDTVIEFLSLAGLLAVVVLLLRAAWRTIWWRAGFERTMAREMPSSRRGVHRPDRRESRARSRARGVRAPVARGVEAFRRYPTRLTAIPPCRVQSAPVARVIAGL